MATVRLEHFRLIVTYLQWARGRSGGRDCTAGQYGYVPLGRHLVRY